MSEYQQFLHEKQLVDQYMQAGYKIVNIKENLSGMFVELNVTNSEENNIMLLITTAEARKYVSTKLAYS